MKEELIKEKIFGILNKEISQLTELDLQILDRFLTYELLDEYITQNGIAVDVENLTIEEDTTPKYSAMALLNYLQSKKGK